MIQRGATPLQCILIILLNSSEWDWWKRQVDISSDTADIEGLQVSTENPWSYQIISVILKGLSGLAAQVGFGFGHRKHWPGLAGTAWRRRPLHTAGGAGGQCGALSADLVLPTGARRGCLGVQQFQRTKWRIYIYIYYLYNSLYIRIIYIYIYIFIL